jgi:selenocysteine lyase/cysteine desulfurase
MIPCQRHLFELPDDVAYFNCAYMSPLSKATLAAGRQGLALKAQPWRIAPADFFASVGAGRAAFAQLIGARADDIAVIPAASYGIATAARNLDAAPGKRIVLLEEQFPSNLYSWRELAATSGAELATVTRPVDGAWTPAILQMIDSETAVVATAQCHWTDGGLIDLKAIGRRARQVGAALVLDLTQSLGALPFSVAEVDPDFAVSACYKWLLGPYSLGFMYVAPRHHGGRPLEQNWMARAGSEDFARLVDYRDDFQPGARRFDVGESANFALMPAAVAAMRQLLEWSVEEVQQTLTAMTTRIAEEAGEIGLTVADAAARAGHFLGLRFPGGAPAGVLETLQEGGVHVSMRGSAMRITPHVYNNEADIARLMSALRQVL